MRTLSNFKTKPLAKWMAIALTASSLITLAHAAAPLAGTEIKNLATVTYEDENGNTYSAQSNQAVITVAEQYQATITNDRIQNAAPGQTVYFPHTLVNTGNVIDTFDLSTTNRATTYDDTNGNGQPDPGEPVITSITLGAGITKKLVVAYDVPVDAPNAQEISIKLTAVSQNNGIISDIGSNSDSTNGTNDDKVIVTTAAVLVLTKQAVLDELNHKITYTLTINNTGGSDAVGVDIMDAVPFVDTDGNGSLDTQLTLDPTSIVSNGLLSVGDIEALQTTESALGWDISGDGNIDTAESTPTIVIKATDAVIPPNTTVSISYSATYNTSWAANANIDNAFVAFEDIDNNDIPTVTPPSSNTTNNVIPQLYAVVADDNGGNNGADGVNDGGDDDNANNDTQYVNTAASGETILFTHTITNNGNGDDIFNLVVANSTYPANTSFTLWNADGTVQLSDSDGATPDTGVLAAGASLQVMVKANLPAGAIGTNLTADLVATSSGDNTKNDSTVLKLGNISSPAVDLAAINADQPNTGFGDLGIKNAHNEGPVLLAEGAIGSTVTFPMTIANESGSSDSYLLTFNNLPAGWSVKFKDSVGNEISSTTLVPANGVFNYSAEVTISNDATQALSNADRVGDVNGTDISDDDTANPVANNDTDNDYRIDFIVTSNNDANISDIISHAVDVNTQQLVSITPNGSNQIQPGGTVNYPHTLKNQGNINEAVEINPTNTAAGWTSSILVDTDGDGAGDTELTTLLKDAIITAYQADGTPVKITLTDTDNDGKVEFPLAPGQYIKLTNKVFAPSSASQGAVNITTLDALDANSATPRSTAQDQTEVILGQVRLDKSVALDAGCDKTADGAFAAIQASTVAPGECAIWKIVATNEGDALARNVVVTDAIPEFTTFLPSSITVDGAPKTSIADDDTANIDANDILTVNVGTGATSAVGGSLASGQSSTVTFTTKVDE